ncbi:MAG: alpha/beta hydrolase [Candidatus Thermoplasmatota archaeon]|nr:alpha/beta hydrolase [Candidatus Thermoplasmatota archaeon]
MLRKNFKSSYGTISYLVREGTVPVVFLHGLGGTGNSWIKIDQFMDGNLGLYFLDMLGHGRSDKPDLEYTISIQEDIIAEFVEHQGLDRISLMGNSYGGWVAARFSIDRREPVHLVLEDSAGVNRTFGELGDEHRNQFVKMVLRSNSLNTEAVIGNIVKNNADPMWKLKDEELRKLTAKTLIIWGKEDGLISIENGRRLRDIIPGSRMEEIEQAGHVPHVEEPERIAAILNEFLKS